MDPEQHRLDRQDLDRQDAGRGEPRAVRTFVWVLLGVVLGLVAIVVLLVTSHT